MADAGFAGCPIGADCFSREVATGHNTLALAFVNKLADLLIGATNTLSLDATRIACTTTTAAPVSTFETLPDELYRDLFVDRQRPSPGKATYYWFFGPTVAIGSIYRWAIMAGNPSAHPTVDGQALNHWADPVEKTSEDTVTGQYSFIVAGV
jgi:hypothetical protein